MKLFENMCSLLWKKKTITYEDLIRMIDRGIDIGTFDYIEGQITKNIVTLGKIKAADVMIPRPFVTAVSEEMTALDLYMEFLSKISSYFPVYSFNKNNITGYVSKENVFESLLVNAGNLKMKELKRDAFFISEDESVFFIWIKMMQQNAKLAIVIDGFNEFQGIIYVEDIIETILGSEIHDDDDKTTIMRKATEKFWYKIVKEYNSQEIMK